MLRKYSNADMLMVECFHRDSKTCPFVDSHLQTFIYIYMNGCASQKYKHAYSNNPRQC